MALVVWRSNSLVSGTLLAFVGNKLRLKVIPSKGEKVPFEVSVAPAACARVEEVEQREKANFTTFTLLAVGRGSAQLQVNAGGKPVTASYPVEVRDPLVLPASDREQGIIVRVLLAETPQPKDKEQKAAALEAMQLMRVVMENRLAKPSSTWGSAGAKTLGDVVRAKNQFEGFEQYPKLSEKVASRLNDLLSVANDGNDPRHARMIDHITTAMAVAGGKAPADPTGRKLYWWRTKNSGPPTSSAKPYKTLANNTFYITQ